MHYLSIYYATTVNVSAPKRKIGRIASTRTMANMQPQETRSVCRGNRTIFGYPRDFLENQFVYLTVSPSARGLAVGINVNPASTAPPLDLDQMMEELIHTLHLVHSGTLYSLSAYQDFPADLRELRHVALSGDREPTKAPAFADAISVAKHVRAVSDHSFFKIALVTNGTLLHLPRVRTGIKRLTLYDEIWVQLDAGTQTYYERLHGNAHSLRRVVQNIREVGSERPVVIQSLFTFLDAEAPPESEIAAYLDSLRDLIAAGTSISRVQIYSVPGFRTSADASHLPLHELSAIAARVNAETGLPAEVF